METSQKKDLSDTVMKGFQLAYQRLVEKAKREDRELVISRDGKIVHVKARDL